MLAVLVAVGNLVVCGAVLVAVTRSAADAPPAGFREVTEPGGMRTSVPAGWTVAPASDRDALRVDGPEGVAARLWFGSSAVPGQDLYAARAECARRTAGIRDGYAQLRLARTVVRGAPAVDWEFEYDGTDGRRHVRSVYWRHDGREYFVRAAAPVGEWQQAGDTFEVMLTHATP